MGSERRAAPRIEDRVQLAIVEDGAPLQAETKNLSTSGAYCLLDRFIAPMTKLQLEFQLPDESQRARVRCTGVVVRAEPVITEADRGRYHLAIFFTDLADRDRATIERYVRQRLNRPAGSRQTRPGSAGREA